MAGVEERLGFETLLADISARFVNVPVDRVDGEIESALHDICEFLGLDMASFWQFDEAASGLLTLTHVHRRFDGPPVPERMDSMDYFPWSLQQVMAGKLVVASSIEDLPPEAARDKEVMRYYGAKSLVTIPLLTGGNPPFEAVSFNTVTSEKEWPEPLVKRLQLLGQVFTNALARKRADEMLRESEERLNLAANSAGVGLWSLNIRSGHYWLTDKARDLFGLPADEVVTSDRILSLIHPDDQEMVRQTIREVLESGKEGSVEYRVILPDGSLRWMVSRGCAQAGKSGKADRLMGVTLDITARKQMEEELRTRLAEIERLRYQIERENIYLREEARQLSGYGEIIGSSKAVAAVLDQVERVAATDATVLLLGETGTGKELFAQAIHSHSRRKDRVMVKVDCASLPSALIESELFGRERGAYTGALTRQVGRFEIAGGSTIFLDEIAEMPLELQAKLLRVLQDGEFERLGSPRKIKVDVRVIAATNRDLAQAVQKGAFREDLYYRLNVFPIKVPPLRERPEDIPALVNAFVAEFSAEMGKKISTIPRRTIEALQEHHWPGNIRELRNVIEQAVITSDSNVLKVNVPSKTGDGRLVFATLEEAEGLHIVQALEKTGWRIKGPRGAAALLGLKPSTLYARMAKLDIPTRREKDNI